MRRKVVFNITPCIEFLCDIKVFFLLRNRIINLFFNFTERFGYNSLERLHPFAFNISIIFRLELSPALVSVLLFSSLLVSWVA